MATTATDTHPKAVPNGRVADRTRANDLDGESWREFASTIVVDGESHEPWRFNGRPILTDADCCAFHRCRREAASPTIWCADRFLTQFGLHIDLFFTWCISEGRPAWWLGHPPAWHEEEVDAEVIADWLEVENDE